MMYEFSYKFDHSTSAIILRYDLQAKHALTVDAHEDCEYITLS